MAKYKIVCLQDAPLPSWEGFFSIRQIRDKFAEYARLEWDHYPGKNWFTLQNIADYWEVSFEKVTIVDLLRERLSCD